MIYLKLRKYYQIEYYLYCLKFIKYCVFQLQSNKQSHKYKNHFLKTNLPINSSIVKSVYSGLNFNLIYSQSFKNFYDLVSKNKNDVFFVKINNLFLTNKQFFYFVSLINKKPIISMVIKPIIILLRILNYNANIKTSI